MPKNYGGVNFEGPYLNTSKLDDRSGVYVIVDGSNYDRVIDVGQSATVKSRVETHDRKEQWKKKSFTFAYAVYYVTEPNRSFYEKLVRENTRPLCGEH